MKLQMIQPFKEQLEESQVIKLMAIQFPSGMSVVDTNTTKYTVQILYVGSSSSTIYVHSASNTGWLPYLINAPKTKYHPAAIIYIGST